MKIVEESEQMKTEKQRRMQDVSTVWMMVKVSKI